MVSTGNRLLAIGALVLVSFVAVVVLVMVGAAAMSDVALQSIHSPREPIRALDFGPSHALDNGVEDAPVEHGR